MPAAATASVGHSRKNLYMPPYYKPQERRDQQINVRVTKSLQKDLQNLARLWTHIERKRDKEAAEVTVSDVVVRLLQIGLDGAWAEVGMRPKSEEDWKTLLALAEKLLAEQDE